MKHCSIIVSGLAMLHKVLTSLWDDVAKQLKIQRPHGRLQSHIALLLDTLISHLIIVQNRRFVIINRDHSGRRKTGRHCPSRIMCRIESIRNGRRFRNIFHRRLIVPFQSVENISSLSRHVLQPTLWIAALQTLLLRLDAQFLPDVMERRDIVLLQHIRILDRDQIFARKRRIIDQVLPVLGLDVELLDGLVGEHIPGRRHRNDMRVLRKVLEQRRALVAVVLRVSMELEANEGFGVLRLARNGIHFERLDKVDDGLEFENVAVPIAIRYLERSHCDATMVEGQPFEFDVFVLGIGGFGAAVELGPLRVREVPV